LGSRLGAPKSKVSKGEEKRVGKGNKIKINKKIK
jgi:hypothetical protein